MGLEEPIAFCTLFGYDANRCLEDAQFNLAQQLRNRLFWIEHLDATLPVGSAVPAWAGGYVEYSLFGLGITLTPVGVPLIQDDHPMTRDPDTSLIPELDFRTSGLMPRVLPMHERQQELTAGRIDVSMPAFLRGGLDIAIQLRGYENWIMDTIDRPQFVHDLMQLIVDRRIAYTEALAEYLCEPVPDVAWLADDWVNIPFITPAMFQDFVLPYYQRLADHYGSVYNFHTCGCTDGVIEDIASIHNMEIFEFSAWTSLDEVLEKVPPHMPLLYSLNSNKHVLLPTLDEIRAHLRAVMQKTRGRKLLIQAGGLQPIHDDHQRDISRLHEFADIAWQVLAE